jgi:hypothetical protein
MKRPPRPLLWNIARACQLWNWHTSPTALRTDQEHDRHRKAANKISLWLDRNTVEGLHWHENDHSGKRYASN